MIMLINIMFIEWTPPYVGYDLQLIMFSLTYVHDVLVFPHWVFIYSLPHYYVFTGYAAGSVHESEAP